MDEQKKCIYNLDNLSGLSHFDECNELMSVKKEYLFHARQTELE